MNADPEVENPVAVAVAKANQRLQQLLDRSTPHAGPRWAAWGVLLLLYLLRVYLLAGFYIVTYGLGIYNLNLVLGFITPQADPEVEHDGLALPTKSDQEFKPFVRRLPEFKFWWVQAFPSSTRVDGALERRHRRSGGRPRGVRGALPVAPAAARGGARSGGRRGGDLHMQDALQQLTGLSARRWGYGLPPPPLCAPARWASTRSLLIGMALTLFSVFDVPVFWPILMLYFLALFFVTMKSRVKHMIKYKYVPFSTGKKVRPRLVAVAVAGAAAEGCTGGGAALCMLPTALGYTLSSVTETLRRPILPACRSTAAFRSGMLDGQGTAKARSLPVSSSSRATEQRQRRQQQQWRRQRQRQRQQRQRWQHHLHQCR
jgi:hypothetical protein